MKYYLHKVGLFFLAVLIAYLFFFDYSAALLRRVPKLQAIAAENNFSLELANLKLHSPKSLEFRDLSFVFDKNNGKLPFLIDEGEISAEIIPLFFFDTVVEALLKAYDGSISISWISNIISREAELSFSAQRLDLLKHPTSFAAGLSGKLKTEGNFKLTGSQFSGFQISEGDLHLEVTEGNYNGGHTIFRAIQSPEIKDITVSLYAKQFPQRIGINSLDIFCSLGRASGTGFIHLNSRNFIERGRIELNARLTPEGARLFGGYFALGAGQSIDDPSRNWKVLITKNRNSPWDFEVRPQA